MLLRRLAGDPRLPRRHKLALVGLAAYLAVPFDLVPDVVPVVGLLDDALLVGLALRVVVRRAGREVVAAHWPGSAASLPVVLRLAGARG